ncbi:MAG: transketolase [Xanthobacteraceae bacterium]|nr:transketolase [Xanthobacteraceae bacterium]
MSNTPDVAEFARRIRGHTLRMVHAANASHIGGCLSMADILAVLYARILKNDPARPTDPDRDRFILSKGHATAILYAALAERGFFPVAELATYCKDGSKLTGHISHGVPGVEVSTGSLGHGLPIAVGMAMASKADRRANRIFCVMSDGECDEGSNWEAILFAPHHKLDNLVAVVDFNKLQSFGRVSEVLALEPFADKWRAFGWHAVEIDGHDLERLATTFESVPQARGKPTVVIAHTIKGRGVSFMEDRLEWHYKSPNAAQLAQALAEVGA